MFQEVRKLVQDTILFITLSISNCKQTTPNFQTVHGTAENVLTSINIASRMMIKANAMDANRASFQTLHVQRGMKFLIHISKLTSNASKSAVISI